MKLHSNEASTYRIALVVLAGLVILGNIGRISLTDRIAFYFQDGLLLLMAGWSLWNWKASVTTLKQLPWIKPLIIFLLCIFLTLMLASVLGASGVVIGLAYAVRFLLYASFFVYLALGLSKKLITHQMLAFGMLSVSVGVAVLGLAQYIFMPDTRFLYLLGYDDHYFRLVSTYFDPPFTAQILMVGLFVLFGAKKRTKKTYVLWVVLFIAFLLTYSRAEYVAFLAGVVTYVVQTRNKIMLGVIALLAVGIVLLPRPASEGARLERTQSIISRATALTQRVRELDAQTMLIGRGWYMSNTNRNITSGVSQSHSSSSDNSYFQVLESTGAIGLAAFLWFLWSVLKLHSRNSTVLPVLVSILVGSLANNIFFYPAVMLFFWTLVQLKGKHAV